MPSLAQPQASKTKAGHCSETSPPRIRRPNRPNNIFCQRWPMGPGHLFRWELQQIVCSLLLLCPPYPDVAVPDFSAVASHALVSFSQSSLSPSYYGQLPGTLAALPKPSFVFQLLHTPPAFSTFHDLFRPSVSSNILLR